MKKPKVRRLFSLLKKSYISLRCLSLVLIGVWAMGGAAFAVEEDAATQIAALRKEVAAVRADQQKTLEALDAIREQLRVLKMRVGKNG